MVGTRTPGHAIHYPVDPAAAAHGASVTTATDSAAEAYADRPPLRSVLSPWPLDRA
jgi:hypothetical protein